ncbi:MAG: hypothetical protein FWD17_13125 [Polyangiaceae bacterium]|nr:hypothetical protein [Polyangiaceae bacterium]
MIMPGHKLPLAAMRFVGAVFAAFLFLAALPVACGTTPAPRSGEEAGTEDASSENLAPDAGADVSVDAPLDAGNAAVDAAATQDATDDVGSDSSASADAPATTDSGNDATCDCVEGGLAEAGEDAPTDTSTPEGGDAGTCTLASAPDAGPGGALNWAENFGQVGSTDPMALAVDPTTNDTVVVGYFTGTQNFGGGALSSDGDAGANAGGDAGAATAGFIAKFDSSGAYKWAKAFTNAIVYFVAIDSSGNIAIAGSFSGTIGFGGALIANVGAVDVFVAELDSTGTFRWSKAFGASGKDQNVSSIVFNAAGDVLIAGNGDSLDLGGGPGTGAFIGRFDSSGAYEWSNNFPTKETYGGPYLAMGPLGELIVAGNFDTTIDLGGGPLTAPGPGNSAFMGEFDPSGAFQWAKVYSASSSGDPVAGVIFSSIAADSCGNVLVTGNFYGTADLGGAVTLTASDPTKETVFLAKVDPTGSGIWADKFVGSNVDTFSEGPRKVAVDAAGRPTLICYLSGSVDYGGGTLTSVGSASVSIASFDSAGAYRWAYVGGSPSTADESQALGLAVSGDGVAVTGNFGTCLGSCLTSPSGTTLSPPGTTLVWAGTTLTARSSNDLFLGRFAP